MIKTLIIFSILALSNSSINTSQTIDNNYFTKPLSIPMYLSGTFGELRGNHFHSGLDIKTQGVIGKQVLAAADGYVSRIKISPWGYGKAIYLKHPNGYSTVYAHLNHFNSIIDSIVKAEQYRRRSFAMDFYPEKDLMKLKQGEVLAYSGNSGGSGGPHLHFEIRDPQERPLNPMNFGITVADTKKPEIFMLRLYKIYTGQNLQIEDFKSYKGKIPLNADKVIDASERFFIGVGAIDKQNGASNRNGIYGYKVLLDSQIVFHYQADRLVFSEKRFINAFIDFAYFIAHKSRLMITRVLPGNKSSIYDLVKNNGIIHLQDTLKHRIDIHVFDHKNNQSSYTFHVKKEKEMPLFKFKELLPPNLFYNKDNSFETSDAKAFIAENTVYEDVQFSLSSKKNPYTPYSKLIRFGNAHIPMHKYANLSIKCDSTLKPELYAKAAIVSLTRNNGWYYEGGKYNDGYVHVRTRSFGEYFIVVDTIAPVIKAGNIYSGKNISNLQNITMEISDNLSGIKSYIANVNQKWVLGEYDPKRNLLTFPIDEHWPKGKITFVLEVRDDKNNVSRASYNLTN